MLGSGKTHYSNTPALQHSRCLDHEHWSAGVSLATSIAHNGALAGAKAMAASAIELFMDPKLVAQAKQTFKEEIGDITRCCHPIRSRRYNSFAISWSATGRRCASTM